MTMANRKALRVGPADVARRLMISIKALKLYERLGIVKPKRTRREWRLCSCDDIDRISKALVYKRMGFSLSQIANLLDAGASELAAALAAQERQMQGRRAELENALAALREARRSLAPALRLVA